MSMHPLLIVLVVILLIAALPRWGYSSGWSYYPSGGIGLVLVVLIILILLGIL